MSDEKISREIWKKNLTTVKPNNNFKFCELSISFFRRIEVECLVKLTPTCFWNLKTSQWLDKLYNFDEWNIKMIATGFWSTSAKKIHYLFRFVSFFFLIVFFWNIFQLFDWTLEFGADSVCSFDQQNSSYFRYTWFYSCHFNSAVSSMRMKLKISKRMYFSTYWMPYSWLSNFNVFFLNKQKTVVEQFELTWHTKIRKKILHTV